MNRREEEMRDYSKNGSQIKNNIDEEKARKNVEDEPVETKPFLTPNMTEMVKGNGDMKSSDDVVAMEKGGVAGGHAEKRSSVAPKLGWRRYLGVVYTMLSTNAFSLSSTVLKKYSHISPFTLGVWAFPLAAVFSVPFIIYTVFWEKKNVTDTFWPIHKHKKVAFFMWFRAVASVMISYMLILSFQHISVADTRTIMAASVITVYFAGWIFLGEKCGIIPIVVALLALCGIGVMTRPPMLTGAKEFDESTLIGVSFALGCLCLVTLVVVMLRYLQHVHHGVLNSFLYIWAFGQSFVFAWATDKLEVPASLIDTLAIESVGILWALGNLFLVLALQVEEAGVVALIRTSEVIFTFFWQYLLIGAKPDIFSLLGAALVLTGVIVVTLRKWVGSLSIDNPTRKKLAFLLV